MERRTVLPPELFRRFENDMFWKRQGTVAHEIPIIQLDG
jgi:hypothetical protein